MNVTILQENLIAAIQDANHFSSHKPQLPILTGIAIRAKDGQLIIQSTDLKMGFETHLGAKVEQEGECVVPGKIIGEFLSSLNAGPLTLSLDKDILLVKQKQVKAKIPTFNVVDFPPFPQYSQTPITFDKETFLQLTSSVTYAASLDETRPILSSMLLSIDEGTATVVCTDGYRLTINKKEDIGIVEKPLKLLLPAKAIQEVLYVLSRNTSKEILFGVSEELSQAFFFIGETSILVRLVEGEFPPFEKVVPQQLSFKTLFDRVSWITALKTSLIFAKESSSIVTMEFDGTNCTIHSSSVSSGENENVIESSVAADEKKKISFNGKFLLDVLSHISTTHVVFQMNDELKPGVILPEDASYPLAVVMPFKR
jgi:DNA polymerase III subunit beta